MNVGAISNNNYRQSFGAIYKTQINRKDAEKNGRFVSEGMKAVTGEDVNGYCVAGKANEMADLYIFTGYDATRLPKFLSERNSKAMSNLYTSITSDGDIPSDGVKLDIKGFYKSNDAAMDKAFIATLPQAQIEEIGDYTHTYCSKLKP